MKKNPLISILISNFNKERFIKKCLQSACSQNYNNYEIILFDDNSTDNSLRIIKKFKRVKLLKGKKTKNASPPLRQINSLLNCFRKSKGHIICFLDSDDLFKKNKLKMINSYFENNTKKNFLINNVNHNETLRLKRVNYKKNKWPSIFPTSCISVRRSFFKKFINFSLKNNFPNLEIDTRMTIFSCFYMNDFNFMKNKLTTYIFDKKGVTSKYKFLSFKWWLKRREAFMYLDFIIKKSNKSFIKSFDYYITFIMSETLKFLRMN